MSGFRREGGVFDPLYTPESSSNMTPAANTTGDQMDSSPDCKSTTSACHPSSLLSLLSLPRELRDLIYKMVVEDSKTSLLGAQNASSPQHSILTPAVYATTSTMVHVNVSTSTLRAINSSRYTANFPHRSNSARNSVSFSALLRRSRPIYRYLKLSTFNMPLR